MPFILAIAAALPWFVLPVLLFKRLSHSTSLESESVETSENSPMVSVIVPARDEARNIAACVGSILGNTYPSFELIVVDDGSADGTGDIARGAARDERRVRVVRNEPPPSGWFGKSWACATGARHAAGEILCFTDADTIHRTDALARSVNAMLRRKADLLSVYSGQRLETHWERIVQPQAFTLIAIRFGGTETVTLSPRVEDKIANGQCYFVSRVAYEELRGHEAVRGCANEDVSIAQHFFVNGKHVVLTHGGNQVSTRMYSSLSEIVSGWGRSLYAGLRVSMPFGKAGRVAYPILLLSPIIFEIAPALTIIAAFFFEVSSPLLLWAATAASGMLAMWLVVYRGMRLPLWYAFLHLAGAAVLFYICVGAILRGRRVSWKGRTYLSE